jgi:predicted HD superfamily hydrolase involved in NAD metabolism
MLDKKRLAHSIRVQETAVKLAVQYNADIEKAATAGLIHDCAKCLPDSILFELAGRFSIKLNDIYRLQPGLLHGPIGACIAQKEFLIDDPEIIHSIKYHTTGCCNMSILDKIIYIADYIEPGRDFPGVSELRELAYRNFDEALFKSCNITIEYVLKRNLLIHPLTIEFRNSLLLKGGL